MPPPPSLLSSGGIALALTAPLLLLADRPTARDAAPVNELCIVAPATPYDPASGLPMIAPRPIPTGARCPVCGMYPARHPHWSAQTVFRDGAVHFFDSPIDLFVFLQRVDHYDRRYARGDVIASYVRDVERGQWIAVPGAFFVHGSAARGPMRTADLPAFASRAAADTFTRRYGGTVIAAAQITPVVLRGLYRGTPHQH